MLFIPVGIAGCGKATFAKNVLRVHPIHVHSSDAIRQEIYAREGVDPTVYHPEYNSEVFRTYEERIERDLMRCATVFADATNLYADSRKTLYEIARRSENSAHVLFFTNASQAVRRNGMRHGVEKVPADAMVKMIAQYENALRDIYTESDRYASLTLIDGVN